MCWFARHNHFSFGRQLYTSRYLQTGLDNMRALWHTANLSFTDLELLSPHGQLTIVLAEIVRPQDVVRVFLVGADDNLMFV